ncbi:hypothetical protein Dsin_032359 [Dipteronia sinensis]|uniref:Pentatricopeptide repeat-containing protein n=1 Tax=Dipteronia sinensis TaxID=43782 RepID=A0AAE0DT37_9ROSI|nr:hypothetical protein Dsin_032359 [Dipteronia sinensis]
MEATGLLKKMIAFGCGPDVVTFGTLIHGLYRSDNTIVALQLHEQVVNGNSKYGVTCKSNVVWYSSIIYGLCKDGFTDKAKELFSEMKGNGILADAIIYTSLIHGLCCVGDWEEAKSLFIEMLNQDVQPTIVTFNVLLDELCKSGNMGEANKLYKLMILRGVQPDTYTYNIFIDGYWLLEKIHDTEKLFVSMASKRCTPNVVSYNILINGFCKRKKKIDNAMNLHREMISKGIRPTVVTYNTLLIGLFIVGRVGEAQKLFDKMQVNDVAPNSCTFTIFIDGFCKNDCVLDALEFYNTLENCKVKLTIEIANCLTMDCINLGGPKWLGSYSIN